MIYKELVKKYQGKYYLGYEMNASKTYVFIKKVCVGGHLHEENFPTYSDVIYSDDGCVLFKQNKDWRFGTDFIEYYGYKEIPKSLFMSVVNRFGFKRLEKNDKKFCTDSVRVEYR